MQLYTYTAKDASNKTVKGKVEGRDERHAVTILRNQHLVVVTLRPVGGSQFGFLDNMTNQVKRDDVVAVTQQLATMLNSGLPLSDAIDLLRTQTKPGMAKILSEVLREVQGGSSFADALAKHRQVFSGVYIALVRAGEAAGQLDTVLQRLAENEEKQKEFRAKTKGALIYPALIVCAMVLVITVLMIFVVPQMTSMYESFGADLPFITQILISISDLFRGFWWLMLAAIFGLVMMYKSWRQTEAGRFRSDAFLLSLPIYGSLRTQIMMTEFSVTLALLSSAGISILEALEIVGQTMDNVVFQKALQNVYKGVEKGMPMAAMMAKQQVFPPLLAQMVSVGEETGELDKVLYKVSTYFEREAEHRIKNLTTAIEPIIMVVLGVVVGFIVLAIITPLYTITDLF